MADLILADAYPKSFSPYRLEITKEKNLTDTEGNKNFYKVSIGHFQYTEGYQIWLDKSQLLFLKEWIEGLND